MRASAPARSACHPDHALVRHAHHRGARSRSRRPPAGAGVGPLDRRGAIEKAAHRQCLMVRQPARARADGRWHRAPSHDARSSSPAKARRIARGCCAAPALATARMLPSSPPAPHRARPEAADIGVDDLAPCGSRARRPRPDRSRPQPATPSITALTIARCVGRSPPGRAGGARANALRPPHQARAISAPSPIAIFVMTRRAGRRAR